MSVAIKKYTDFCNSKNIQVKPHQVYGVLWCLQKELRGNGGVIADEMGMGKTIQMIGTMILNPQRRTLILLPPILIQQWFLEIERICGHRAILYYGKKIRENITKTQLENKNVVIVITSYETCLRDDMLASIQWDRIICDEAHHLRNPKTKTYQKIRDIPTRIFWCLTGTPIHNTPKDLASLFLLCKIEKPEWKHHFLQRFQDKKGDLGISKRENAELLEWKNERERDMAKDIHASIPCLGFVNNGESFWEKTKTCTLVSMIRASQMCIFPKMIQSSLFLINTDFEDPIPEEYLETLEYGVSTKLQAVIAHILERKENGNGKIIFCHYRLEMKRIVEILKKNGVDGVGDYKTYLRQKPSVSTPILIMQIRSGCEGLNLQAAFSEVYFVSPNWNPALESQAVGRCFRIGQQKRVEVFRFYMNCVDSPVNNAVYQEDIQKYGWIMNGLPTDIIQYISEFIDPLEISRTHKYSLDKYIQANQERKREKIEEFLRELR